MFSIIHIIIKYNDFIKRIVSNKNKIEKKKKLIEKQEI